MRRGNYMSTTNYSQEIQDIQSQIRFTKNRLAGLTMEMDEKGQDAGSLDEALEALDDVIDILAEYLEK